MRWILWIILLSVSSVVWSQISFDQYFTGQSLRFDFLLAGNSTEVKVFPQQIKQEPVWSGSRVHLSDPFGYGNFRFEVFDDDTGESLFSRGFNTLFQEWQTTAGAKQIDRSFYQAIFFPFPKQKVLLQIDARKRDGSFKTIYETKIDPDDYFIIREKPFPYETVPIQASGDPRKKVDLAILAEGYTGTEMDQFLDDARRLTGYLFEATPFKEFRDDFNVTAVLTPSAESGTDIPGEGIYRNTTFNSTFYTFDINRYLTSSDMKPVYDAAAVVPYDHLYLLVNSDRYGGGGIYNFLSICTSDNRISGEVFIHEFGHGFAGLGDEYYTSDVAYENYYNLTIEPWEPNLTTLVDFDAKWRSLVSDSTKIPTPRHPDYSETVGVFEGGGYLARGIYSPWMNCRMKSNNTEFCPVCSEAIRMMIQYYCE